MDKNGQKEDYRHDLKVKWEWGLLIGVSLLFFWLPICLLLNWIF